jgi:LuxR family transcriptional regulator, quorum-sensing system regulator SdiA
VTARRDVLPAAPAWGLIIREQGRVLTLGRIADIEAGAAKLIPLAPAGYFLAIRVRGSAPLLTFATFPQAWMDEYMERGYMMRDPVTTWALTLGGSIRWSSPFLPDPFGIFREAAKHGLTYGASVATGPVSALTLCSLARGDRDVTDAELAAAKAVVTELHELTAPPKALAQDDRAILAALAAGKAGGTAARLDEICDLMSVRSPQDAARRARDLKLI